MAKLTHYQAAFLLSTWSAAIILILWGFVFQQAKTPNHTSGSILVGGLALVIPLGIWLGSNFARYVGAIFMLLISAVVLWPLVSLGPALLQRLPLAALYTLLAGINLVTASILLLSKRFDAEWAKAREEAPKYKVFLRRSLLYATLAAMFVATFDDIIKLTATN